MITVLSKDRLTVGGHLKSLKGWMPELEFRLELVHRNSDGSYRLDDALLGPIREHLDFLASHALSSEPLKVSRDVKAALDFFGVKIPEGIGLPVDADNALTGPRKGKRKLRF